MYVFFFKQKTAYEMRISDWSSDVCSSDLPGKEGFCRQSGGQRQQYDRGQQVAQRHPGLGKAAPEPAAAVWTMLSDQEDGPAPFAAKRKSLYEAQYPQQRGRPVADRHKAGQASTQEIGRTSGRARGCQYV